MDQPNAEIRNLQIRQTTLEEKANQILNEFDYLSIDEAFQALSVSLLFDVDYDAIQPEEIVDGGQDKQIDIIRVEDDIDHNSANIHIIQSKNAKGFSSNALIQMRNGLSWIFERPRADYQELSNQAFVNKIEEIRDLRLKYGTSNLAVFVYFVTNGDTRDISDEFRQESKVLLDYYTNVGFEQFRFRELGSFELMDLLNESERTKRAINADIPFMYDVNRASLIEYDDGDTKAVICTMAGTDIAKLASQEPRDAIFDLNVRPFYGARGKVNQDIENTCTDSNESSRFWFLNNGLTLVCDRFSVNKDPDSPIIKLYNVQIVNGCQTTVTLREAWEHQTLQDDVRVLVRIYATDNATLTERITLTTNNQNKITDRDLRANDEVQRDIQRAMKDRFGVLYERKNKEYRSLSSDDRKWVVPNVKAAQAYLAIVRRKPSIARGYLAKIWADHYSEIFENATVEDLLASYLIYDYCFDKAAIARKSDLSELEQEVAVYGAFHIAQIVGFLITNGKWGGSNKDAIAKLISETTTSNAYLEPTYSTALAMLVKIRKPSKVADPSPALYFKASDIQGKIGQALAEHASDGSSDKPTA